MRITLASTSKFKNNILDTVKIKHDMVKPDFLEESNEKDVYKYVCDLSLGKAKSVRNMVSGGIIIGIDTVVLINGRIVEKPKNLAEARQNLVDSSNNTVSVISGVALINMETNQILSDYQETKVVFNEIRDEDIEFYLENEPDALYASGFIVETIASNFIKEIHGSYYNILGVPVEKIYQLLNNMGIYLKNID